MTRTITAIYAVSLLTILTSIQLNLIGRYTYLDSLSKLNSNTSSSQPSKEEKLISFETERQYLSFSWFLLHDGLDMLLKTVKDAIETILEEKKYGLDKEIRFQDLLELVKNVRERIETGKDSEGNKTIQK